MILEYAMNQIRNLSIVTFKKLQDELNRSLTLPDFLNSMIEDAQDLNNTAFQGCNTLYKNPYPRTIRIAPSPAEMLHTLNLMTIDLAKIDRSDLSAEDKYRTKQDMIRDKIRPKQIITIKERPLIWWGDTLKGLNIRVGYVNNDRTKSLPFKLGGNASHMGAVGDTGEGKSVMMNAVIMALLLEQPPWELNLTMNDGKMQEYGIYGKAYRCPQIRNIAITESSAYLTSVFKFFDEEMKIMNSVYEKVGVKGLGSLRDYLDLYIPTQLMVHDEFAQAKALASPQEASEMDSHLQSVAKLGRSNRYHLFPTSQELRGHLEGSVLNQFQIGLAVGTNDENSKHMLGNDGAVDIKGTPGFCIVNTNRAVGKRENNIKYKVPFLPDDTDEDRMAFQMMLKRVTDYAKEIGVTQEPTVYNEKDQMLFSQYEEFQNECNELDLKKPRVFGEETLVNIGLGVGTVYTGCKDTYEFFRWNYGRRGNILIHSQDVEDIKYILKLLGNSLTLQNIKASHKFIVDNAELYSPDYLPKYKRDLTGEYNLDSTLTSIQNRELILKYMNMSKEEGIDPTITQFIRFSLKIANNQKYDLIFNQFPNLDSMTYDDFDVLDNYALDPDSIKESEPKIYEIITKNKKEFGEVLRLMNIYLQYTENLDHKYLTCRDFPVAIHWFLDPRNNLNIVGRAGVSDKFVKLLEVGPSVGFFSVIVLSDTRDMKPMITMCMHEIIGKPTSQFENNPWVQFKDPTGLLCKYLIYDGDGTKDKYFKKFMILDED